jgi:transcriptional regulator with XRE-family HTH domain
MDRPNETQKKLADFIGVSQPAVGKWLNGNIPTMPGSEELWKISQYFGVAMESLFPGEHPTIPEPRCDNLDEMKLMRDAFAGLREDLDGIQRFLSQAERRLKKF